MLCVRILQAALVYLNTLMVQDVLADQTWADRLTAEDRRGLTPLFSAHVAPCGEVRLDMGRRLPLHGAARILAGGRVQPRPDRPAGTRPGARPGSLPSTCGPSGPTTPTSRTVRVPRQELDIEVICAPKKLPYVPIEPRSRVLRRRLESPPRQRRHLDQDPALHWRPVSESSGSRLLTSTSTPAVSGSPRAKAAKTALFHSPPHSRRLSPCTSTPSAGPARCPVRVELEEALQRPRRPQDPRPVDPSAGITSSISPHGLRDLLFTWLKTQGIDDSIIQPYSGHATRQSLEIYSRLALADAGSATTR